MCALLHDLMSMYVGMMVLLLMMMRMAIKVMMMMMMVMATLMTIALDEAGGICDVDAHADGDGNRPCDIEDDHGVDDEKDHDDDGGGGSHCDVDEGGDGDSSCVCG